MWNRRTLLKTGVACGTLALAGARVRFAHAALTNDSRFIVVVLRGGLDGLAAVPVHGDPDYTSSRGVLALPKSGSGAPIDLDGFFGLHPALENLGDMWRSKEAAIFHNVSTPYRDRSHFDGQNVLETGGPAPHRLSDGWLNRALRPLALDNGRGALAVANSPPLLLDGKTRVTSWMPSRMPAADEDFLTRVSHLYAGDPVLGSALNDAMRTRATAEAAMDRDATPGNAMAPGNGGAGAYAQAAIAPLMEGAGRILVAPDGARVAVFDVGGWDTHANQGAGEGQLSRRLQALDEGLATLKNVLEPVWSRTAVLVVSEFGRTVAANGTRGTDHGTAGAAFLLGGNVAGGTIHAEWVGLKNGALRDGRDLPARTDMRVLFKSALADHLNLARNTIEANVFPDSGGVQPLRGLFRT